MSWTFYFVSSKSMSFKKRKTGREPIEHEIENPRTSSNGSWVILKFSRLNFEISNIHCYVPWTFYLVSSKSMSFKKRKTGREPIKHEIENPRTSSNGSWIIFKFSRLNFEISNIHYYMSWTFYLVSSKSMNFKRT